MACIDVVMPSPPRSAATVSNDNNNNNNTVMICGKTILVSLVSGRYTYLIHRPTGNTHTAQGSHLVMRGCAGQLSYTMSSSRLYSHALILIERLVNDY